MIKTVDNFVSISFELIFSALHNINSRDRCEDMTDQSGIYVMFPADAHNTKNMAEEGQN